MSNRKLQEFDLYEYGSRGVLRPGDLFRVSGGPYYENEDGSKTLMAERGMFKFRLYCARGASRWIEATRVGGGTVVLWVGKAGPNKDLPSFRRKPYKIRKVTERKGKSRKKEAGPAVDAVCAAKQKAGKGKDAGDKAAAKVQAGRKTGTAKGTKGSKGSKGSKPRPKPKVKSGSTSARAGSGEKRGKNGGKGGEGRGKGPPSTSGSTSI